MLLACEGGVLFASGECFLGGCENLHTHTIDVMRNHSGVVFAGESLWRVTSAFVILCAKAANGNVLAADLNTHESCDIEGCYK